MSLVATHADGTIFWHFSDEVELTEIEPAKCPPEIPPPVWDCRPVTGDDAMAAVRAMCGAAKHFPAGRT